MLIENCCFEDVTHAYARMRRITRHTNNNKPRFPDVLAVTYYGVALSPHAVQCAKAEEVSRLCKSRMATRNSISANVWKICAASTKRCAGKDLLETTSSWSPKTPALPNFPMPE